MGYYKDLLIKEMSLYEGLHWTEEAVMLESEHYYICQELEDALDDGDTERAAQLASLLDINIQ